MRFNPWIVCLLLLNDYSFSQISINIHCDSCAVIKGKVIDYKSKESVMGADLYLQNMRDTIVSDIEGYFIFNNLLPGKYILNCKYAYFPSYIDTVILSSNESKTITIELLDEEEFRSKQAFIDIQNNDLKIYLDGWPIFKAPLYEINKIANKYGFQYEFDGSCDPNSFHWDKYNSIIMDHLDRTHGEAWREKIEIEKEELYSKYKVK